jgi:hypothetical protein
MSYTSLGEFTEWATVIVETDEVYVWRGTLVGVELLSISDVQAVALAMGKASMLMTSPTPTGVKFYMMGITLLQLAPGSYKLDAAFKASKADLLMPYTVPAASVGAKLASLLQQTWPKASVADGQYMVINDNEPKHPALDFWLSHPVIWDPTLGGGAVAEGGPTQAWSEFKGLWRGTADQGGVGGGNLKPWPRDGTLPKGKNGKTPKSEASWLPAALLLAGIGYIVYARRKDSRKGVGLT